jgi:hypothetical protein
MYSYFKKCLTITAITIFFFSCQKGVDKQIVSEDEIATTSANDGKGATQISGIGYWDATDGCNSAGQGADFALTMTGDINGCLYVFVDEYECSPSGTYRESGREKFVGTYNGQSGSFWTTYRFEAKYEGCNENGSFEGLEILGRCQHPITDGSGTGVFNGVTGRLDLKDNIEEGSYPYRGYLRW